MLYVFIDIYKTRPLNLMLVLRGVLSEICLDIPGQFSKEEAKLIPSGINLKFEAFKSIVTLLWLAYMVVHAWPKWGSCIQKLIARFTSTNEGVTVIPVENSELEQ